MWLLYHSVRTKRYAQDPCLVWLMGFSKCLSISFRVTSLALGQSHDCPSASEATLKDMGKEITWIHEELAMQPQQDKAQQNREYLMGYTVIIYDTWLRRAIIVIIAVVTDDNPWWRHGIITLSASWWRHQMETFSALLVLCAGNSPVTGEFPAQKPVTQSFDVLFDLRLNKRLRKQWWDWWFETPSCPLWRLCNHY